MQISFDLNVFSIFAFFRHAKIGNVKKANVLELCLDFGGKFLLSSYSVLHLIERLDLLDKFGSNSYFDQTNRRKITTCCVRLK